MRFKYAVALMLLGGAVAAAPVKTVVRGDVTIRTSIKKEYNEAVATALFKASPETIWSVITDFNHHAGVMPHVTRSVIIAKKGNSVIMEKELKVPFKRIAMVIRATYVKLYRVLSWEQIKGPLLVNRGVYELKAKGSGCSLTYTVQVKHKYFIPGWLQRKMTEKSMSKLFTAIKKEAARRSSGVPEREFSAK